MKTLKSEEVNLQTYRSDGGSKGFDRGFHRRGLQPTALAFVAGISPAGGVRSIVAGMRTAQKSEL